MNSFVWIEAHSAEQAVAELSQHRAGLGQAVLKAGGVDLLDRWKEGLEAPARVVNLRHAQGHGLGEVQVVAGKAPGTQLLQIGALRTLAQLADDPLVRQHAPILADAAGEAATPQIRQLATLGGNLLQRPRCWYFRSQAHQCKKKGGAVCFAQHGENELHAVFDNGVCAMVHPSALATALVALGGQVTVLGDGGERTVALEDLITSPSAPGADLLREHRLGPAEVLTAALVPLPGPGGDRRSGYVKLKQKQSFDWPLCEAAAVLRRDAAGVVTEARIVLGAVAPVPWRAKAAEAQLLRLGRAPKRDDLLRVGQAAQEGAHPLEHNGYKLPLIAELVQQVLSQALAGSIKD